MYTQTDRKRERERELKRQGKRNKKTSYLNKMNAEQKIYVQINK